jgi:transposase
LVAIDERGRELASKTTTATTTAAHLDMMRWADQFGSDREWAVENCRHLSRRLESDLLAAGERIRRVPPKLMANARDAARTYGKSDPIDALAVARAALREPDLPHRPTRWSRARTPSARRPSRRPGQRPDRPHQPAPLAPPRARSQLGPTGQSITSYKALDAIAERLGRNDSLVARIASDLVERIRALTITERALEREITQRVVLLAPCLLAVVGVGPLIAAKTIAEVADVRRFKHKDAFARHNGTAPLPAWSGNPNRRRLSRTGNRQLSAAIHRIGITQLSHHPDARAFRDRRTAMGDTPTEALRALKRRLSDVVFRALLADAEQAASGQLINAA